MAVVRAAGGHTPIPLLGRLAVTILVPVALLWVSAYAPLPGIDPSVVERVAAHGGTTIALGGLALGTTPILTAFWIVEVIAFLVPRWSRLRHSGPENRAKLNRAAVVLMLLLAGLQAFGIAAQLRSVDASGDAAYPGVASLTTAAFSVPVVAATLVGGVCVQFVAAQFVSRHGLANGLVVLTGANLLRTTAPAMVARFGALAADAFAKHDALSSEDPARELAIALAALLAVGVASWAILRDSGRPPTPAAEAEATSNPYRDARGLTVTPWIPLPVGSLQAYFLTSALLMLPSALAAWHLPVVPAIAAFLRSDAFEPVFLCLLALAAIVLGRLMLRPAELSDLAARLGAAQSAETKGKTRTAFLKALAPSLLFFLVVTVSKISASSIVILVAIALDLAHSIRLEWKNPSLVTIWEERRAAAVPVLRAALAADGVETHVRGAAVLGLWQIFAPYAPVELRVGEADAVRATKTLRHLLLGDAAPEREPTSPLQSSSTRSWSVGARSAVLAVCALAVAIPYLHIPFPLGKPTSGTRLVYGVNLDEDTGTKRAPATGDSPAHRDFVLLETKETVRHRLDAVGLRRAAVTTQGDQLVIDLPELDTQALGDAKAIVSRPGQLAFTILDDEGTASVFGSREEDDYPTEEGIARYQEEAPDGLDASGRRKSHRSYYARMSCQPSQYPRESLAECLLRFQAWTATLQVPADRRIGFESVTEPVTDTDPVQFQQVGWRTLYLDGAPRMTGESIVDAAIGQDKENFGQYYVMLTFSSAGATAFEEITGANVNRRFAIELDGVVDSAPVIKQSIRGGRATITMGAGDPEKQLHEARQLEAVLRAGALPARLTLLSESRFGDR